MPPMRACAWHAPTRRVRRAGVLLGVVALIALVAGCGRANGPADGGPDGLAQTSASAGVAADVHPVGGAVCAGCHAEEAARWRHSHHDLAIGPATPATALGDFGDTSFAHDGIESRFFARGDELFVETEGADGTIAEFRVAYTFGVTPLQQYLVDVGDGRYQAFGVAWDSRPVEEGGQRWFDLYPEDTLRAGDPLHWTAAAQNWNSRCAACHSTALEKGFVAGNDGAAAYDTTWDSLDVDCEACHGPGRAHAAAPEASAPLLARAARAWVFEPGATTASLRRTGEGTADGQRPAGPATEIETCALCHSRRAQLGEPLEPGVPMLDQIVPARLDAGLYHADGQILDEVFVYGSFAQSAMYHAGVTCTDCHDPHSTQVFAEGNALCTRCHAPAVFDTPEHHHHDPGGRGSDCVDCHMRAETYMVVDPRRDHSFRVPRPDLTRAIGTPNACADCHAERGAEWAAARVAEWYPQGRSSEFHYGVALAAGRDYAAERAPLLYRLIGDPSQPAIARATALTLLAAQPDAATGATLAAALEDSSPLVQLAAIESVEALPAERHAALLQRFLNHPLRALRTTAARILVAQRDALSTRRQADLDAALNEYVAVQLFNADRAEGWLNRGSLAFVLGRLDEAETAYRRAVEREPGFAASYAQLADLYRVLGDEARAREVLAEGLAIQPAAAELHYALGLALTRAGEAQAALDAIEAAVEAAPDAPLFRYAHALALDALGRRSDALAALEALAGRFPSYRPALVALTTLYRDTGDARRAVQWAETLLEVSEGDPTARAILMQLDEA